MRLALIPPLGYEEYALMGSVQLALSISECMNNPLYMGMIEEAKELGHLIIADNGAAEGYMLHPDQIASRAKLFGANEIVLPDVMGDLDQTAMSVRLFMDEHAKKQQRYMVVLHGKHVNDMLVSLEVLMAQYPNIKTVGLPRMLLDPAQGFGTGIRIDLARMIYEKFGPRINIHLLGTHPSWLTEIRAASKYAPFIRSVDTSAPFNYALVNKTVDNSQPVWRSGGSKYFTERRDMDVSLLKYNILTMKEWAGDL